MNKIELLQKKIALRNKAEKVLRTAETEKRTLNRTEKELFNEIRSQIGEVNTQLESIDAGLAAEKQNVESRNFTNHKDNMPNFIATVLKAKAENRALDAQTQAVIDGAAKEMRDAGITVSGIAIPMEFRAPTTLQGPISGSEMTAGVVDSSHGATSIHPDYQSLLGPVFADPVLSQFDSLTGLTGDVVIPRYGGASATWKGELAKADETTLVMNELVAKPKRLTTTIVISKKLLIQSDYNIEQIVRKEISDAITRKLQVTVLGDSAGTDTQPAGLFLDASTFTKANATFEKFATIEQAAEEAFVGNIGYIITPAAKAVLRTKPLEQGAGAGFIFQNNEILGNPVTVTTDAKGILVGDLKSIVICQWGGLDLVVDPYTLAGFDALKLTVNAYFDIVKRYPLTGEGDSATEVKLVNAYKMS